MNVVCDNVNKLLRRKWRCAYACMCGDGHSSYFAFFLVVECAQLCAQLTGMAQKFRRCKMPATASAHQCKFGMQGAGCNTSAQGATLQLRVPPHTGAFYPGCRPRPRPVLNRARWSKQLQRRHAYMRAVLFSTALLRAVIAKCALSPPRIGQCRTSRCRSSAWTPLAATAACLCAATARWRHRDQHLCGHLVHRALHAWDIGHRAQEVQKRAGLISSAPSANMWLDQRALHVC